MPNRADSDADRFQWRFERAWPHLTRPHVRALAWLLDAPDLLDPAAAVWGGRIVSLAQLERDTTSGGAAFDAALLASLEQDPAPLDAALGARFYSRLGLYAEKLMAFYFQQRGLLVAHGLQVRASKNDTVGEFDFLLRHGGTLLHWEFATKFYLRAGSADGTEFNGLVGPNLADTLGVKMRKILDQQLALGQHPAAQSLLPQPVDQARALVKGWLFYPDGTVPVMPGISAGHNHGFWRPLASVAGMDDALYILLPRLLWLAPYKAAVGAEGACEVLDRLGFERAVAERLTAVPAPLMVARVIERDGWMLEVERGFIVPDDWQQQAELRRLAGTLPS
jgi:hypothetical protein